MARKLAFQPAPLHTTLDVVLGQANVSVGCWSLSKTARAHAKARAKDTTLRPLTVPQRGL